MLIDVLFAKGLDFLEIIFLFRMFGILVVIALYMYFVSIANKVLRVNTKKNLTNKAAILPMNFLCLSSSPSHQTLLNTKKRFRMQMKKRLLNYGIRKYFEKSLVEKNEIHQISESMFLKSEDSLLKTPVLVV